MTDADHDVLGLQIAVHDAEVVSDRDGGEGLHEDVDDARVGQRPLFAEDREEIPTVEELHREVDEAVRLDAEVDHAHRVGVIEAARGLGLAVEPLLEHRVLRDVRPHDLERDRRVEDHMPRPEDLAHRAAADVLFDRELAGDDAPQQSCDLAHPPSVAVSRRPRQFVTVSRR